MSLAILVPVLRRPHRVVPLLESIAAATPEPYRVVFIADPDDFAEQRAVHETDTDLMLVAGTYAQKINAAVRVADEPLLFFGADDLHFHPGWLDAARAELRPGVGVVGTQDLCNGRVLRGEHATHFLVTREYAQLPTIDDGRGPLCEEYEHEWTDDEFVGTARKRGAWAFAWGSIVEHLHPNAGKAPSDELYAAQGQRMRRSRPIFNRRRPLWT